MHVVQRGKGEMRKFSIQSGGISENTFWGPQEHLQTVCVATQKSQSSIDKAVERRNKVNKRRRQRVTEKRFVPKISTPVLANPHNPHRLSHTQRI
jgi:hypothetical protein